MKMRLIPSQLHRGASRIRGNARQNLVVAAVATALGVSSAPPAMAQAASAADLQNLQEQVQKLQRESDRMKAQQQQAQAAGPPAQPQSPAQLVSSPKDPGKAGSAPTPSFMAGRAKENLWGLLA